MLFIIHNLLKESPVEGYIDYVYAAKLENIYPILGLTEYIQMTADFEEFI